MAQGDFQRRFHEELDAFDRFATERSGRGGPAIGTEDPDVRRILEAIAFFSARTRDAAAESMREAVERLAGGSLDALLCPMPATMLVRAVPDDGLPEPVTLPLGTVLRVEPHLPPGARSPERKQISLWSTLAPVRVLPLKVTDARIEPVGRGLALKIEVRARLPQKGLTSLRFHVRRLGDYRASLGLANALARHVTALHAGTDGGTSKNGRSAALPCPLPRFGAAAPTSPLDEGDEAPPLLRIRSFFHFPERDLFMDVALPPELGEVHKLELTFALDGGWPEDQGVSRDSFELFVVPAVNAWSDLAAPILVDGTQRSHPIRGPAGVLDDVELHSVRGVYRRRGKELVPILPRGLALDEESYEVLQPYGGAAALAIRAPAALDAPASVLVDAVWSQPALWASATGKLSIVPQRIRPEGVKLHVLGPVRRPEPSPLALDPARCLDVLALRMRPRLDRRSLVGLLSLLGAAGASPYCKQPRRIVAVSSGDAPDRLRRTGIQLAYHVEAVPPAAEDAPLEAPFNRQIQALLDAWAEDATDLRTTPPRAAGQLGAGGGAA